MRPRLAGARRRKEQLMEAAACRITHDVAGLENTTVDPVTLELIGNDEPTTVYEGPCQVRRLRDSAVTQVGRSGEVAQFRVELPHDAPAPAAGDAFVFTTIDDDSLLGAPCSVVSVDDLSAHPLTRNLTVQTVFGRQPIFGTPS